jgi:prevent-host-death family protein
VDATRETLEASVARERFSDSLNRVCYGKDRLVIARRGRPVAALVPMEDLELIRQLEDRIDLEAARRALRERNGHTLAEVRASLGI